MKIYLKSIRDQVAAKHRQLAGSTVFVGLRRYRRLVDSVSVYLGSTSREKTAGAANCKLLIHTIHGGVLMISSKRGSFFLAVRHAIRQARKAIREVLNQLPEQPLRLGTGFEGSQGMPVPIPIENRPPPSGHRRRHRNMEE